MPPYAAPNACAGRQRRYSGHTAMNEGASMPTGCDAPFYIKTREVTMTTTTTKKVRRNWKRLQPTSLRHALELSKDHARERLNKSVERIADEMGVTDHWVIYKWVQNGRIPANMIRPFEAACGIDYVTRWLVASGGRVMIDLPIGRKMQSTDVVELHNGFGAALQLLNDFYSGKAAQHDTVAAISAHLEQVAWHRANVIQFNTPELDFNG